MDRNSVWGKVSKLRKEKHLLSTRETCHVPLVLCGWFSLGLAQEVQVPGMCQEPGTIQQSAQCHFSGHGSDMGMDLNGERNPWKKTNQGVYYSCYGFLKLFFMYDIDKDKKNYVEFVQSQRIYTLWPTAWPRSSQFLHSLDQEQVMIPHIVESELHKLSRIVRWKPLLRHKLLLFYKALPVCK